MTDQLIVPKQITVGYQERTGTYTGKLAYVTYRDHKDVLRKEKSWEDWRDKKIEPAVFDNEPTEGFVINKSAGGYTGGWNRRQDVIRIYDPRDFEIEINVDNLLFILEECAVSRDKRIEGNLVYSWDRTQLVLLPASSQEYESAKEFTTTQEKSVKKSDMIEGYRYVLKDTRIGTYLGFLDYCDLQRNFYEEIYVHIQHRKCHVFQIEGEDYLTASTISKVAEKLEVDPEYADKYKRFKQSIHGTPPEKIAYTSISKKDILAQRSQYPCALLYMREKNTGKEYVSSNTGWYVNLIGISQKEETKILLNSMCQSQFWSSSGPPICSIEDFKFEDYDISKISFINDYGNSL